MTANIQNNNRKYNIIEKIVYSDGQAAAGCPCFHGQMKIILVLTVVPNVFALV